MDKRPETPNPSKETEFFLLPHTMSDLLKHNDHVVCLSFSALC